MASNPRMLRLGSASRSAFPFLDLSMIDPSQPCTKQSWWCIRSRDGMSVESSIWMSFISARTTSSAIGHVAR
uniref:Uncharacterized protein n=1 Tax=Arundo donax TaxID=35708 RepID=A0A0A9BLT5_ARUDO